MYAHMEVTNTRYTYNRYNGWVGGIQNFVVKSEVVTMAKRNEVTRKPCIVSCPQFFSRARCWPIGCRVTDTG